MASRSEVSHFLLAFKQAASTNGVDLVPRHDTKETQRFLGLTNRDVEELLLSLSVADYCEGPTPDRGRDGDLWVFGASDGGYEIYIKLKAHIVEAVSYAKCISFHIAERPLRYPLCDDSEPQD
jgi:hypothetical protein